MSFEVLIRQCADHADKLQREAEALEREEARLSALALMEARMGDVDKLWSSTDYRDNHKAVIQALLRCAQDGHVVAKGVLKLLADTYGQNHAEVDE